MTSAELSYEQQVEQYAATHSIEEMKQSELECYRVEDLLFLAHCKTRRDAMNGKKKNGRDFGLDR